MLQELSGSDLRNKDSILDAAFLQRMTNMKSFDRQSTPSSFTSVPLRSRGKQPSYLLNKSNTTTPATATATTSNTSTSTTASHPSERKSAVTYVENRREASTAEKPDKPTNTVSNYSNVKIIPRGNSVEHPVTPDEKPFSFLPNSVSPRPPLGSRPQGFGPNFTPLRTESNYLSAPGSMNSTGLDLSLSLSVELEADLLNKQYYKNRKINATAAANSLAAKNKNVAGDNDNNNIVNDNKVNSSPRSKGKIYKKEKAALSMSQSPPRSLLERRGGGRGGGGRGGGREEGGGGGGKSPTRSNWNSSQSLKNDIPNGSQLRRSSDDVALGTFVNIFF